METVGELGVFLILFCCGLEFSPASFVKACAVFNRFFFQGMCNVHFPVCLLSAV